MVDSLRTARAGRPSRGPGVEAFIARARSLPDGFYRELEPASDLRGVVACGWIHVVRSGASGAVPIIPDGCTDITTYDDDAPLVVGPDANTRWVQLPRGLVITGLRLRPGAARRVFGCSARELLGESARLGDLQRGSERLERELQRADTARSRIARLEDWVRARLERQAPRDRSVIEACRAITRHPQLSMDALAEHLGWNARMLHREFVAACGYGPKYMQRIMRVQGVLRAALDAPRKPRLSEIAARLGFADQAHMTRDFRSITGFAPSAYLLRADGEVGRWIDESW
jgi:AraC-like DNA-binding protein